MTQPVKPLSPHMLLYGMTVRHCYAWIFAALCQRYGRQQGTQFYRALKRDPRRPLDAIMTQFQRQIEDDTALESLLAQHRHHLLTTCILPLIPDRSNEPPHQA